MSQIASRVVTVDFSDEILNDYAIYGFSVIAGRALPSIEDGLKPVQRRILWYMHENHIGPDGGTVKSAKITNSVSGTYHPHSDPYDQMVNMGRPYMSLPLITPKGSFGVTFGDEAAASRYTEAKLSPFGALMLADVEESVDFVDNYDSTRKEPRYLAPSFPNLVINGTSGIAVGYACKFPDHNPVEVMDLAIALAETKDLTLCVDDIMKIVPGPDFGTGGIIIGVDGIRDYMETGTGTFIVRGEASIKDLGRGRSEIIITSLPYGISAEALIDSVKKNANDGNIVGITGIKELTDKNQGLRVSVFTKKGVNAVPVLDLLYKLTPLEQNFAVNATAIDRDGVPHTYSMLEMMQTFIRVRESAIVRKSKGRKEALEAKVHQQNGLVAITADIDKAISIIRNSENAAKAKTELMKSFSIDEGQADYVLSLQLRKLTRADDVELKKNIKKMEKEIAVLAKITGSEKAARSALIAELKDTKTKIARDRKCKIVGKTTAEHKEKLAVAASTAVDVVSNGDPDPVVFDGVGVRKAKAGENGLGGRVYALYGNGECARIDLSTVSTKPGVNVLDSEATPSSEPFVDIASADDKVITVNVGGNVKVVDMSTLPKTASSSDVIPDRELVNVQRMTKPFLVFVLRSGKTLKIDLSKVRAQGRGGNGVAGVNIADGDAIVNAFQVDDDDIIYTRTNDSEKSTPVSDIPVKGRGTGGVVIHTFRKADVGVDEARPARDGDVPATPRGKSGTKL